MKYWQFVYLVNAALSITSVFCQFSVEDSGCGVTKTCQYLPEGCNGNLTLAASCRLVSWKKAASDTQDSKIEIELRGTPGSQYIAIGFGQSNLMENADLYYCTDKAGFESAALTRRYAHPEVLPLENGMNYSGLAVVDRRIHCKFTRPMSVSKIDGTGKNYNYDLNSESFYILLAEGPLQDGFLSHHQWKNTSNAKIFFPQNFNASVSEQTTVSVEAADKIESTAKAQTQANQKSPVSQADMTTMSVAEQTTSDARSSYRFVGSLYTIFICHFAVSNLL